MTRKQKPQRMCVVCRTRSEKRNLTRLVRTPEGVQIDTTGKRHGRGAYLCQDVKCWDRAVNTDILNHALRTNLSAADRQRLRRAMPRPTIS